MKTLQDLVDKLNDTDDENKYDFYYDCGYTWIVFDNGRDLKSCCILKINPFNNWRIDRDLFLTPYQVQKAVVKFLANSDRKDWFKEKRYNIIIGIDTNTDFKTAYRKTSSSNAFEVNGYTELSELRKDPYIFTEKEIEDLKVTLPPDLSKIVDLGKVEVTFQ